MTSATRFVFFNLALSATFAHATMPTHPGDANFQTLPNGKTLSSIRVSGTALTLSRGSGATFGSSQRAAFDQLVHDTQTVPNFKVQWALMDLDAGQVLDKSLSADKRIFGASSSKVFVAGTLLDFKKGALTSNQLQLLSDMLVVSSNVAWTTLQSDIGDGNANKGRERNYAFTQRMGYEKTQGFQGYWGKIHGNELTANDTVNFLYDTYQGRYPGAEYLWKLMHTCRTGATRARKYLPTNLYVGGKTGTYDGPSFDTDAGTTIRVKIRNQMIVFNAGGREYGLMVLANSGSDETAALLAGGLYRKYVNP